MVSMRMGTCLGEDGHVGWEREDIDASAPYSSTTCTMQSLRFLSFDQKAKGSLSNRRAESKADAMLALRPLSMMMGLKTTYLHDMGTFRLECSF